MDDVSYYLLKLYSQRTTVSLRELSAICNKEIRFISGSVRVLIDQKYLEIIPDPLNDIKTDLTMDAPIRITTEGHIAFENESKERRHFKFNEIRAWITLAIALVALVLSVIDIFIIS